MSMCTCVSVCVGGWMCMYNYVVYANMFAAAVYFFLINISDQFECNEANKMRFIVS